MRTPPTETITVARADETTTDGRRTTGAPTTVGVLQVLVEPCAYNLNGTAGRRTITHGCNLYHRGGLPFGILVGDLLTVRGRTMRVTRTPEVWQRGDTGIGVKIHAEEGEDQ